MTPRRTVLCLATALWLAVGTVSAKDINVSLTGDDAGPGSRQAPYRTLSRAQSAARDSRRDHPAEPVTVWINPGDWPLPEPLVFTEADSGTPEARVLYRAVPRAVVRLIGQGIKSEPAAPLVQMQNASCLMLRGVTICEHPGVGLAITGGAENVIAGCTLQDLGGYAITIQDGREHAIQSCDAQRAAGGISITGTEPLTAATADSGHRVINNHLYDLSASAIACGIAAEGQPSAAVAGIHVSHNLIHDVRAPGIQGLGRNWVVEFNEVSRCGQTGIDLSQPLPHGGQHRINDNLVHQVTDGFRVADGCGNEVHRNVAVQRIDRDAPHTLQLTTGFQEVPAEGSPVGAHSRISNNLAVHFDVGFAIPSDGPAGFEHNLAVGCGTAWQVDQSVGELPLAFGKNRSYETNPGFVDPARLDFQLKSDAQALQDLPGLEAFPTDRVGLSLDKYRTRLPDSEILRRFSKP